MSAGWCPALAYHTVAMAWQASWNGTVRSTARAVRLRRRNKVSSIATGTGLPGRDQQRHHQPRYRQAQVIGAPAGTGEELVRPVMRPGPGQARPGQHAAHGPPPRLRQEPAGQAPERAE